jgi:trigger factor
MKSVVEPLEGNKVKLSVEVDEQEFEKALDAAFRRIAREVRIPGFRPGKAPRRVLEARLGRDVGRQEALRESLPDYYAQAVRDNDVDVIAPPELEITAGREEGPVSFDAVVEVRPQISIAGYSGLRVAVPNPEISDEDVDVQVDRLRSNFGELSPVSRPARNGDHLTVDLKATRSGEPVAGMTTDDFLYELGSGTAFPELDDQLQGSRRGDIFAFDAEMPDGPVHFQVLVKDVKEKALPDVTDEWASEASEFETVDELRSDIRTRVAAVKRVQAQLALRSQALQALTELVSEEMPEPLVSSELQRQAQDLEDRLAAQGSTLPEYLEAIGQREETLVAELHQRASESVKADLALRALADAESIEVSDAEVDAEIERLAGRIGQKPAQLRRQLERDDRLPAIRSDLRKSKALEWLVEHVEVVDEEGHQIDRGLFTGDSAGEPGVSEPGEAGPVESGEA